MTRHEFDALTKRNNGEPMQLDERFRYYALRMRGGPISFDFLGVREQRLRDMRANGYSVYSINQALFLGPYRAKRGLFTLLDRDPQPLGGANA